MALRLTAAEKTWMISQVLHDLIPKYGSFPRPATIRRHRQQNHARERLAKMKKLWEYQHIEELLRRD
jgi:hypothetical protein